MRAAVELSESGTILIDQRRRSRPQASGELSTVSCSDEGDNRHRAGVNAPTADQATATDLDAAWVSRSRAGREVLRQPDRRVRPEPGNYWASGQTVGQAIGRAQVCR
jgi:hypothetical protein